MLAFTLPHGDFFPMGGGKKKKKTGIIHSFLKLLEKLKEHGWHLTMSTISVTDFKKYEVCFSIIDSELERFDLTT